MKALTEPIWGPVRHASGTPLPVASRGDTGEGSRRHSVAEGGCHSAGRVPQWDACPKEHLIYGSSDP